MNEAFVFTYAEFIKKNEENKANLGKRMNNIGGTYTVCRHRIDETPEVIKSRLKSHYNPDILISARGMQCVSVVVDSVMMGYYCLANPSLLKSWKLWKK